MDSGNGAQQPEYQIGSPDGADDLTLRRFASKLTASHSMQVEWLPSRHLTDFSSLTSSEEASVSYREISLTSCRYCQEQDLGREITQRETVGLKMDPEKIGSCQALKITYYTSGLVLIVILMFRPEYQD